MYNQYFGFQQQPFSLTPDTDQFVNLHGHQECFDLITYALSTGEGFVKVIGDVGTGKTIICRKLLRHLKAETDSPAEFVALYIPNPLLSPTGLFRALANELGIRLADNLTRDIILEQITAELLELANQRKSIVIIVDEAQALPEDTLEALRLVTNLETEKHKLVQVILFGQTELDELLAKHQFRQLKQRITFSYHLNPLNSKATEHYIRHRTMKAGNSSERLFSEKAIKKIYQKSKGFPRIINILAHKSLLAAYSRRSTIVDIKDVTRAVQDSGSDNSQTTNHWFWSGSLLLIAVIALLGWLQLRVL